MSNPMQGYLFTKLSALSIDTNLNLPDSLKDGGVNPIIAALKVSAIPELPASKSPELIQLIQQSHPTLQVLATMDETTFSSMAKSGNNYVNQQLDYIMYTTIFSVDEPSGTQVAQQHTIVLTGNTDISITIWNSGVGDANAYYRINGGGWVFIGTANGTGHVTVTATAVAVVSGQLLEWGLAHGGGGVASSTDYTINPDGNKLAGNFCSNAITADSAILSYFKHLKILASNGTSSHATPVQAEIYGNADSYVAPLHATKFTIDVTDPRIVFLRSYVDATHDYSTKITAGSAAQTVWNMTVAGGMSALPAHDTILATEVGVASILLVEKSVLGTFADTVVLNEMVDYTMDYSTSTATKITLSASAAADIANGTSKLRITWIADVMKIAGATNNTALKLRIYLNRVAVGETSPDIEPIAIGTGQYVECLYGT